MDSKTHSNGTPIDICGDLNQFFREVVGSVRQRRAYVTTSTAESYIAGLLADHAHPSEDDRAFDKPLTIQLAQALSAVGTERFQRLRRVGDGVLTPPGFSASTSKAEASTNHTSRSLAQELTQRRDACWCWIEPNKTACSWSWLSDFTCSWRWFTMWQSH